MANATLAKNNNFPAGVNPLPGTDTITAYDSGTILGTTPPGKAGLKLIDGTQQSATLLTATQATGSTGNCYGPSQDAAGNLVQNTSYQGQPLGYSQLGE